MHKRIETSSGSAYLPKRAEKQTKSNTQELTKEMRRTNFTLGFNKTNHLEPRVITVISEEDEYMAMKRPIPVGKM